MRRNFGHKYYKASTHLDLSYRSSFRTKWHCIKLAENFYLYSTVYVVWSFSTCCFLLPGVFAGEGKPSDSPDRDDGQKPQRRKSTGQCGCAIVQEPCSLPCIQITLLMSPLVYTSCACLELLFTTCSVIVCIFASKWQSHILLMLDTRLKKQGRDNKQTSKMMMK